MRLTTFYFFDADGKDARKTGDMNVLSLHENWNGYRN